jgi:phosphoglycerate kinase
MSFGEPKGVEEKYSLKHILKTTEVLGVQLILFLTVLEEAENAAADYNQAKFYY